MSVVNLTSLGCFLLILKVQIGILDIGCHMVALQMILVFKDQKVLICMKQV